MHRQGKRGRRHGGLAVSNFRGYDGHEGKGGTGERGAMKPPTIEQHHYGTRVRGVEAIDNGLPRKGRLTTRKGKTRGNGRTGRDMRELGEGRGSGADGR